MAWSNSPDAIRRGKKKICESCGREFLCYEGDCWCDGIEVKSAIARALRDQHQDCLCETCLKGIADGQRAVP